MSPEEAAMRKGVVVGAVGVALYTSVRGIRRTRRGRRLSRRLGRWMCGRTLDGIGRLEGLGYRLSGNRPDPDVADVVITDRIRSSVGNLSKRLDVPRIHVTVDRHVAHLHGEVGCESDVAALTRAVQRVPGVDDVVSHLHVGLLPGDTRPSTGRGRAEPSRARRRLVRAVVEAADVDEETALRLVRGILATFAERLPTGERRHLVAHLPADLRPTVRPRRRSCGLATVRSEGELDVLIATKSRVPQLTAVRRATRAVLRELRELVPEETADVAAVLPSALRELWARQPVS